ncbi:MAG: NUDIX domain-containing protein [Pseudomonadota bacterium]|jgi:8-oxo-dGTP diphosphatase
MIPLLGGRPEAGRCYRRRPGAYAILLRGGEVLLTHQAAPVPEFQLPGGGIDPGESPFRSLHREVMEETGWTMSPAVRLGAYRRFTWMPEYGIWAEKVCHVFVARPGVRRGPPSEAGHTAVWMPAGLAIDTLASEGDRHFLAAIMAAPRQSRPDAGRSVRQVRES